MTVILMTTKKKPTKKTVKKLVKKNTGVAKVSDKHSLLGKALPNMSLETQEGTLVNLKQLGEKSTQVVLYFYPKDDTPGCTTEACDFRDNMARLQSLGVRVLGVSPDDHKSHQKFRLKHELNFDLLVDKDHKLADKLGVWKLKKFMGREYMGVERSTFLIANGKIIQAWQPVKVAGHIDEVLTAVTHK